MARGSTLRLGEGARCSVLVKNLRPTREVTQRIINPSPRQRVTDLEAHERIFFTSPLFPNLELHAAKKFPVVTQEGHGDRIWNTPLQADGTPAPAVTDDGRREILDQSLLSRTPHQSRTAV